jgi:hypothetical protein
VGLFHLPHILTTLNLDRAECVEVVVELREQIALEFKLRGRFGKLSFANVCASIGPRARHRFATVKLLRRRVVLLDPLPDKPAQPVGNGGQPDLRDLPLPQPVNHAVQAVPLLPSFTPLLPLFYRF